MGNKFPDPDWRATLLGIVGDMLLYAAIAGLLCLASYLISPFFQTDWHLTQYVALAAVVFVTLTIVAVYRRSRQRL